MVKLSDPHRSPGKDAYDNEERKSPMKQAYTLMTPLESMAQYEDGHLLYKVPFTDMRVLD